MSAFENNWLNDKKTKVRTWSSDSSCGKKQMEILIKWVVNGLVRWRVGRIFASHCGHSEATCECAVAISSS